LHFRYSLHDTHQPEDFELRLIFGFEQLSFGCRKKPSLTSLINTVLLLLLYYYYYYIIIIIIIRGAFKKFVDCYVWTS